MFDIDCLREDGAFWGAALSLACASKLSYEPRTVVEAMATQSWGFEEVEFFGNGETHAFFAQTSDVALLAFRGVDSLGDWLEDFRIDLVASPYGDGKVHRGFLEGYKAFRAHIRGARGLASFEKRLWITGHSLGGALATLAMADLTGISRRFTGAITYGQPRIGNDEFKRQFAEKAGNRFFRFVNDEDLITRIPPGWKHVGQAIYFDEAGKTKSSTAVPSEENELPAVTLREFARLKSEIEHVQASIRSSGVDEADISTKLDASIEGLFPAISDHSIDRYIATIRRQIPGVVVDATVSQHRAVQLLHGASEATRGEKVARSSIPVILRVKRPDWKPTVGITVHSRIGDFISAQVPSETLEMLKVDSDILTVQPSRDASTEELHRSVPFVGGVTIHRSPIDERGDAALVGVIDSGIDVLHKAFSDAEGNTRIIAVWNQLDSSGPTPNNVDAKCFQPAYGCVYSRSDIQSMLSNSRTIPEALRDPDGHGTHVTSIAAGRGIGSCPDGMAPDAGIVVVIPNMITVYGSPPSIGYSASHMDALHFLRQLAKGNNALLDVARPIAINVSQGMNAGGHDGTSLLEAVFDSVTTKGQDPGCVIVKSAGNERSHGGHARVRAAQNGVVDVTWLSTNGFRLQDYFEVWYDAVDELAFFLIDPAGHSSPTVSRINPEVTATLGHNVCQLILTEQHPDSGDNRLSLIILPEEDTIQDGIWTLNIIGTNVRSREGWVDIWVERDRSRAVSLNPQQPNCTLSIPGTADTVITVGACDTQDPVRLASFSSYGRTRKDGPKPDICAPGINILAAKASDADHMAAVAMDGTSMAAPHVTGALALVLSHRSKTDPNRQYNAQQLRQALILTARNRNGFHHEGFGWGVLDAEALFNRLK